MLPKAETYDELREKFEWKIPEYFNIGVEVCDKWANERPEQVAIESVESDDFVKYVNFGELRDSSNKLANLLVELGIKPLDRIGVMLPQLPETAIAHIAVFKNAAISVPLFTLFGEEALKFRLSDAGIKILITNQIGVEKISRIRDSVPELQQIISVDNSSEKVLKFNESINHQSEEFDPLSTKAEDPALIIYTSGTTGNPKGALHAHRVLLGHLPGMEMSHNLFPQADDKIWTPADWSWIGGLLNITLPALYHAVPVVACRFKKFTGEQAFQLLADRQIRNTFLPATALKLMKQVENPKEKWSFKLRSVASGGESLGEELVRWGQETFGLTINEFYGQTECNLVVSSCEKVMDHIYGKMGRVVPGHIVKVVDDKGEVVQKGKLGNIAVKRPDPVMLLEYWNNSDATKQKYINDWLITGDKGRKDKNGWLKFVGRDDDVITSASYRIGPSEIENCLLKHPAIVNVGVIGKPDKIRGEIVKAYIVLTESIEPSNELKDEIQNFVKDKLSAHEYPRELTFLESLPLTITGKVIRRKLREFAMQELETNEESDE